MHDAPTNETENDDLDEIREGFTVDPPSNKLVQRERSALDDLIAEAAPPAVSCLERRRHRRVRATIVVGAVGIAALAGGAVAATGVFARTGETATGSEDGVGELIRIDADDAPTLIDELGREVPLPPGGTWDSVKVELPEQATFQAEESIRSMLEFNAACQWTSYWLQAESSDNRAEMATAQEALDKIPNRPNLSIGDERGDGKKMWHSIADAARVGDPARVLASGYEVNCER